MGAVSTSTTALVSPRPRTTHHVGAVRVRAAARHLHPQLVVVSGGDRRAVVRVRPGRHPVVIRSPALPVCSPSLRACHAVPSEHAEGPSGALHGCCDREQPPGPPRRPSAATSSRRRAALLATPTAIDATHDDDRPGTHGGPPLVEGGTR